MIRVVYNADWGGFGLSEKAERRLEELKGAAVDSIDLWDLPRHDPDLLRVVDELGVDEASDDWACLRIAEVAGDRYIIDEYDGVEKVITPEAINWVVVG